MQFDKSFPIFLVRETIEDELVKMFNLQTVNNY